MRLSLFESFADMIENIPASTIIQTLKREQRALEENPFWQCPRTLMETKSILNFSRFVAAILEDSPAGATPLPSEHLEFYRRTITRLIAAEELPFGADDEFDAAFSGGNQKPLAAFA